MSAETAARAPKALQAGGECPWCLAGEPVHAVGSVRRHFVGDATMGASYRLCLQDCPPLPPAPQPRLDARDLRIVDVLGGAVGLAIAAACLWYLLAFARGLL